MKWTKIVKTVIIIVAVILIGGLIYETVAGRISHRRADAIISDLRADNQRLRDGLDNAQDRVVELEGTIGDLKLGSEELGRRLAASTGIAAELRDENQRLRGITSVLRDENIRLGDAISAGEGAAGSISDASRILGESINRAWSIVGKYSIPTGSE